MVTKKKRQQITLKKKKIEKLLFIGPPCTLVLSCCCHNIIFINNIISKLKRAFGLCTVFKAYIAFGTHSLNLEEAKHFNRKHGTKCV